jgi:hypothetical protein
VRNVRLIADRVSPRIFYGLDFVRARMIVSIDAGATFGELDTTGLPSGLTAERPTWRETPWPLIAAPDKVGHLWLVSRQGLYRSVDGGRSFGRAPSAIDVEVLSFGKAAPGRDYPALFAIGRRGNLRAIWRSDDEGVSWVRINDERHEYGRRFRCIAGDPRIFGRASSMGSRGNESSDPQSGNRVGCHMRAFERGVSARSRNHRCDMVGALSAKAHRIQIALAFTRRSPELQRTLPSAPRRRAHSR